LLSQAGENDEQRMEVADDEAIVPLESLLDDELKQTLRTLIDELPAEELELAEHLLARLEMDRLWKEVREGFTEDWAAGNYARLDEIIRRARTDLKQHTA